MAWHDLLRWGRKSQHAYADLLGRLSRSLTGKVVNRETALGVSALFGGCRVIGNGMAQVPFKLMRESLDGKTRVPAKDHPLYALLAFKPNPWQTSYEFRETVSWHREIFLNAYVFINRSATGEVLELIPIEPQCVMVKRAEDWTLTYEVRSERGNVQPFPAAAIWHLKGPSWNSWRGIDFLAAAREALGLSMAAESSQAALHRNGVQASGSWVVDGKLDAPQFKALREWIEREHVGPDKAGVPMILDRAAKWVSSQMSGVDAQHIETRRFQIEEVCRYLGIMPIMVGYSDKASTYASAEQMFLAHAVHCLSPRWTSFEQSADAFLLTDKERAAGLYFDFVEEGMIRGSAKDTKDMLLGYVNGGLMTPNEGRAKLDLNPDADPESDKLRIPVNVAQEPKPTEDPPPDKPAA